MARRNKPNPLDQRMTLAEARARIAEFKTVKKIEGKGGGAAVSSGRNNKAGNRKAQR